MTFNSKSQIFIKHPANLKLLAELVVIPMEQLLLIDWNLFKPVLSQDSQTISVCVCSRCGRCGRVRSWPLCVWPADRFATELLFAIQIRGAAVPGIWEPVRISQSTFLEALLHQRCSRSSSCVCTLERIRGLQMLWSLPECLLGLVVLLL